MLVQRLNEHPEVIEEINLEDEDQTIQLLFTPERMALIEAADAEIEAGHFYTAEEVREHFVQKREAWNRARQP